MQTTITAGLLGSDVRMVCRGLMSPGAQVYDYGLGVQSAALTFVPVASIH